jgi:anti-sigma factor RsiW
MNDRKRNLPCDEVRERFALLLDEEGEEPSRDEIRVHLRACPSCAAAWDEFRAAAERLRSLRAVPTEEEARAIREAANPILAELRREAQDGRRAPRRRSLRTRTLLAAAAAAAVLALVVARSVDRPPRLRSADVTHYYDGESLAAGDEVRFRTVDVPFSP